MHDIFQIVLALYLIDCIVIVNKNHYAVFSIFGHNYIRLKPGLHLSGILPFSRLFIGLNEKILFLQEGVFLKKENTETSEILFKNENYHYLNYSDIDSVEQNSNRVIINRTVTFKCMTKALASQSIDILNDHISNTGVISSPLIVNSSDNIKNIFAKIKTRDSESSLRLLFSLSELSFYLIFFMLPLFLYTEIGLQLSLIPILTILALVLISIPVLFIISTQRGKVNNIDYSYSIPLLLYPINQVHARFTLFRYNLTNFPKLVIYAFYLSSAELVAVLRREYSKVVLSKEICSDNKFKEFLAYKEQEILAVMGAKDISIGSILEKAGYEDASSLSYCPLCETEYTRAIGICSDCSADLKQIKSGQEQTHRNST